MQSAPASQTYVVGVDSHNRLQTSVRGDNTISSSNTVDPTSAKSDPYNSTNNVTMPTKLLQNQTTELTLSSINLKKTQWTIESLWNRLFVSEQIELMVADSSQIARTQFTLELSNGAFVTAQLPPYLNPITEVKVSGSTAQFTTAYAHGLHLADFWNAWGDPIRVVSTSITDSSLSSISSSNANFSIISSNQFQLSNISGSFPVDGSGYFGYVWAPGIPGPVYLAEIVTAALNFELDDYSNSLDVPIPVSHVNIYYNLQEGLFSLSVQALPIQASREIIDPVAIAGVASGQPTLSYIMGFGNCCIANTREIQNALSNGVNWPTPGSITREYPRSGSLKASFGPTFRTYMDLDVGNYDSAAALGTDIDLNWNRFWFDPSCTTYTVVTYRFVFTNCAGVCYAFDIPFGLYTPEQFAQYLQTQMNTLTSTNIYQVSYTNDRFTFNTTNNAVFGIQFADTPFLAYNQGNDAGTIPVQIYQIPPQYTTIAVRMGFDNVNYRGESSYSSIRPVPVPKKQAVCNDLISPPRRFQFVTQWKVDGSSLRLTTRDRFAVYSFTPAPSATSLVYSGGQLQVTTSLANGFQTNDIVRVTIANGTTVYLRVIQVLTPFVFIADVNSEILTSLGVTDGGNPISACVETATLPIINLYLSQNLYNNKSANCAVSTCDNMNPIQNGPIAPRLLGMGSEDVLWDALLKYPFVGMADVVLNFPDYLLIVVSVNGNTCFTHTSHLWQYSPSGQDNMFVMAVISSHHHHTLTWERFVPSSIQLSSISKLANVTYTIYNPDHTQYQLHNVDWSATLNANVVQASGQMLSS